MKRMLFFLMLLLLLMLSVGETRAASDADKVETKISSAQELFKKGAFGDGNRAVLDAVVLSLPGSGLPGDVTDKIVKARTNFETDRPGDVGVRLLREAYSRLDPKGANEMERPGKPGVIAAIAKSVDKKLELARVEARKGNDRKVVELLLECLLVINPLQRN